MDDQALAPLPPRLGDRLPNFVARTTSGLRALHDFRGRWLLLLSHPGDFTPVCTSEFLALARASDRFAALDCQVLALSVDSLPAHFAWIRMIRDRFGIAIDFPIIEDPTLEIARAYGMTAADAADAATVRATYFLDPEGILRASTCYPATVGRSVDEMLRLLAALQRVDRGPVLAPADWRPGEPLLAAPNPTLDGVLGGPGATDWFYRAVEDQA